MTGDHSFRESHPPHSGNCAYHLWLLVTCMMALPALVRAADKPYFVAYDHSLEEPGNLELSLNPILGFSRSAPSFVAFSMEFEYGVRGWWTTEFYLDGQKRWSDSALFTGSRWENRFRPLMREHWINPVLYVEFENLNGADKTMNEVVGFDSERDKEEPNAVLHAEHEQEIETRLILSSNVGGWNITENFLAVKSVSNRPWEFGYAFGVCRPLALAASPYPCNLCRENFKAGIEFYGGLGDWHRFGFSGTSQYVAPLLAWELSNGVVLRFSPTFGFTRNSNSFLLRFGVAYEFSGFGRRLQNMIR